MKRHLCLLGLLAVGLCALPAMSQEAPKQAFKLSFSDFEKANVPLNVWQDFSEAFEKDDAETMYEIMENYPMVDFSAPRKDEYGNDIYPICTAARKGMTKMIESILEKTPKQINVMCKETLPSRNLAERALENKHVDTALMLLRRGIQTKDRGMLARTAENINDEDSLKELIPALLDKGVPYNEIDRTNDWVILMDAFYTAASGRRRNMDGINKNFIIVLRDELKQRGIKNPTAEVLSFACPPLSSDLVSSLAQRYEQNSAARLLKEYGIKVHASIEEGWYGCLE